MSISSNKLLNKRFVTSIARTGHAVAACPSTVDLGRLRSSAMTIPPNFGPPLTPRCASCTLLTQ